MLIKAREMCSECFQIYPNSLIMFIIVQPRVQDFKGITADSK